MFVYQRGIFSKKKEKSCKISHTTDDFPATRLLGVDPSASDLQRRTFFRGAHHLAVVAHANHADTAARQNLPVTVLHILEETVAGWDLWNKSADFSCNPAEFEVLSTYFRNFTLKLRNERKQLSATAIFFILKNGEDTVSENKSLKVDWKLMHLILFCCNNKSTFLEIYWEIRFPVSLMNIDAAYVCVSSTSNDYKKLTSIYTTVLGHF